MKSFVAVLPDKQQFFVDIEEDDILNRRRGINAETERKVAETALANAKIYYSTRKAVNHVIVEVYELSIRKGELVRGNRVVITLAAPQRAMTQEEFETEIVEVLKPLPVQFHQFVMGFAFSHSSNLDERFELVTEMVSELETALTNYNQL